MTVQEIIISLYDKVASGEANKALVSLAPPGQPYTDITAYRVGKVVRIDVKEGE